jgi:purine-nucleoside phosphorylase
VSTSKKSSDYSSTITCTTSQSSRWKSNQWDYAINNSKLVNKIKKSNKAQMLLTNGGPLKSIDVFIGNQSSVCIRLSKILVIREMNHGAFRLAMNRDQLNATMLQNRKFQY